MNLDKTLLLYISHCSGLDKVVGWGLEWGGRGEGGGGGGGGAGKEGVF